MFLKRIITSLVLVFGLILISHAKVIKVEYYSNGNVKMELIKLKKGIIQVKQYYPSGNIFEVGYSKNGLNQGQWTRYDENGNIIATAFYQNHVKIGSWNHYNRWDQSVCKVSYVNGIAVSYKKYNDDGELIAYESRSGY